MPIAENITTGAMIPRICRHFKMVFYPTRPPTSQLWRYYWRVAFCSKLFTSGKPSTACRRPPTTHFTATVYYCCNSSLKGGGAAAKR